MSSPAREAFREWQERIRLTADHQYLVQKQKGGAWEPVPGCTDAIPKDKGAINALMMWASKQAISAAVDAIKGWDGKTPPEDVLSSCVTAHTKRRDAAADSGTSMHALFEHEVRLMMGQAPPRPDRTDEQQRVVDKFLRWAEKKQLRPFSSEARVYHPVADYAGTLDLGASVLMGPAEIMDYKPLKPGSTARVWDNYVLQSAAYRGAHMAMCGIQAPLGGRIIFYPTVENPDGEFVDKAVTEDVQQAFAAFCGALLFSRWSKRWQGRRRAA